MKQQTLNYWLTVFLFLFSILSIGVFLWQYGQTGNLMSSLGISFVISAVCFAAALILYGLMKTEDIKG